MEQLTVGSLFSGIGGIELGLERAGFKIAWQCEIDDYATKVLAKHWPDVARFRDIRECGKHNLTSVDLICGGFPCQDISVAGKRAGIDGERSGLWREFYRIICELRPRFVFVENVSALLNGGIDRVLGDLSESGYDAEWQIVSAEALGAPHLRERVFIVAYARRERIYQRWQSENAQAESIKSRRMVKDGLSQGNEQQRTIMACPDRQGLAVGQVFGNYAATQLTAFKRDCSTGTGQWATEPLLDRVVNGVPHRVDRLRGLGNAVVPQVAEYIGNCIVAAVQANQEVAV